jgi:nucleoside-diphosphate-sugar epimerase
MTSPLKIFITGSTGFIGAHFLNKLSGRGHFVKALRRSKSIPRVPLLNEPYWVDGSVDSVVPSDLEGMDVLVHLAATGVSPQVASWEELLEFNVVAQLKLLKVAAAASVKKIIIAGTAAEYGSTANDYEKIPPNAPLNPTSSYAASKAAGFLIAQAFCLKHQVPLSYHRIFSVYGDGQFEKNLWPSLKAAAKSGGDFLMTSGEQIRDFIEVEAVAKALVESVEMPFHDPDLPLITNIGSGQGTSILEFAEQQWRLLDAKGQLLPGKIPSRAGEPTRFVALL